LVFAVGARAHTRDRVVITTPSINGRQLAIAHDRWSTPAPDREDAMYGIAVEYAPASDSSLPDPLERAACRAVLVRQPGYRRRLALVGDGWRRVVDLFLFGDAAAAQAALAGEAWQAFVAAHPACRDAAPALLASECAYGGPVTLLRSAAGPTRGGQACWRDHLTAAEPDAVLW
jgi:hypothetical protein